MAHAQRRFLDLIRAIQLAAAAVGGLTAAADFDREVAGIIVDYIKASVEAEIADAFEDELGDLVDDYVSHAEAWETAFDSLVVEARSRIAAAIRVGRCTCAGRFAMPKRPKPPERSIAGAVHTAVARVRADLDELTRSV